MDLAQALKASKEVTTYVHGLTNEINGNFNERTQIALTIFQNALDIADGILVLIESNLAGAALTLARPLHESYVRGVWLLEYADNNQIDNFKQGICPSLEKLINSISKPQAVDKWVGEVHHLNISGFHNLAHGGNEHVIRRLKSNAIEPNYPEDETINLLQLRNQYYINIGAYILDIIQDEEKLLTLRNKQKEWNNE